VACWRGERAVAQDQAQSGDQLDGGGDGEDDKEKSHGSNYALGHILPPVAGLTTTLKFLPY
jgi:hypothetical protein